MISAIILKNKDKMGKRHKNRLEWDSAYFRDYEETYEMYFESQATLARIAKFYCSLMYLRFVFLSTLINRMQFYL